MSNNYSLEVDELLSKNIILTESDIRTIKERLNADFHDKIKHLIDGLPGAMRIFNDLSWFTRYQQIIDFLIKYDIKGEMLYLLYNDVAKRDWHILGQSILDELRFEKLKEEEFEFDETTNQLKLIRNVTPVIKNIINNIESRLNNQEEQRAKV